MRYELKAGQALRLQAAFEDQQRALQSFHRLTVIVRGEIASILPDTDTSKSAWRLEIDGDAAYLVEVEGESPADTDTD